MEKTIEKSPLNNRIPKVPFNILLDNKLKSLYNNNIIYFYLKTFL